MYLSKQKALEKIARGEIVEIQKLVNVEFDNSQQCPLSFEHQGRRHEVLELLQSHQDPPGYYHYLVRTYSGIYNLVMMRDHPQAVICPGKWVLNFRVAEEGLPEGLGVACQGRPAELGAIGGGTALVGGELLCVVNFHGHLCPELAIGYRAAKLALSRLKFDRVQASRQKVVVHNAGAAVDAIQYLTGCTVGKRNLIIHDEERHQYEFITEEGVLELVLNPSVWRAATRLGAMEKKIGAAKAAQEELSVYWATVDRTIDEVLHLSEEELFRVRWLLGKAR